MRAYFAMAEPDGRALRGARRRCGNNDVDQLTLNVATGLENELADYGGSHRRRIKIRTTLEAMRGVGVQTMPLAAAAHRCLIKPGGLHQDVFRFGGDHRVPTAHHSRQPDRLFFVCDDQIFGVENTFDAVQGLELFSAARATHDDAAFELVSIEGVGGMAHGEGDEVGCVDRIGDELLLQQGEALGNQAAGGLNAHMAERARSEASAEFRSLDRNFNWNRD